MNYDFLEQILMAVDDPGELDADLLRDVAAEYDEAVVEVNERLTKIGALLNRGLRGEALQLAERDPKFMDQVAALDFQGLDRWYDILQEMGLRIPPRLKMQVVEDIDRAYEENSGLAGLLKKHRLLALAKAPLDRRLVVLRAIQKKDPTNPVWTEDLESWERARLAEIAGEVSLFERTQNRDGLMGLQQELSQPWIIPTAKNNRSDVRRALDKVESGWARSEMARVGGELNAALGALDVAVGRQARDEWNGLVPQARLDKNDAMLGTVAEALTWLDEEDRHQADEQAFSAAIEKLEESLERQDSLQQLNRAIYSAQKFQCEIPTALMDRARRRRSELELAGRRRMRALVGVSLLLLLGVAVAIGMTLRQRYRNQSIGDALTQLGAFQDHSDFAAAEKYYPALPEFVRADAGVASLWSNIEQNKRDDEARATQFRAVMDEALAAGADDPRWDLIDRAKATAIREIEKNEAAAFQSQVEQRQTRLLNERSQEFRSEIDQLVVELNNLEADGIITDELARLTLMRREFVKLKSENQGRFHKLPRVSSVDLNRIDPLLARIDGHLGDVEAQEKQRSARVAVSAAVGDAGDFLPALKRLSETMTNSANSTEIENSMLESSLWRGLAAWKTLASAAGWEQLADQDPGLATELLDRIAAIENEYPGFWLADSVHPAVEHLNQLSTLTSQDEAKTKLVDFFRTREMKSLYMVTVEEKERQLKFYCALPPNVSNPARVQFKYFDNLQLLDETGKTVLTGSGKVKYVGTAPQNRVSEAILTKLESSGKPFTDTILDLIAIVLGDRAGEGQAELDPILRAVILDRILRDSEPTDLILASSTAPLLKEIDLTFATRTDWIDPTNENALVRRHDVNEFLTNRSDLLGELRNDVKESRAQVAKLANWRNEADYDWVGWAAPDSNNSISIEFRQAPQDELQLFVLMKTGTAPGKVQMRAVGWFSNGSLRIDHPQLLQFGRPVYAMSFRK